MLGTFLSFVLHEHATLLPALMNIKRYMKRKGEGKDDDDG